MASIEGLTVEQCQQLARVEAGNLILIDSHYKDSDDDRSDGGPEEGSEDEHDHEEAGSDEEDEPSIADQENGTAEHVEDANATNVEGEVEDEYMNEEDLPELTTGLYLVLQVNKDANDTVTDIVLEELAYNPKVAEKSSDSYSSYQMYGRRAPSISSKYLAVAQYNDTKKVSIKHLIDNINRDDYLYVNCSSDDVRNAVFRGRCPARCRQGWIRTQQEMHEMVKDTITVVTEHQPVCPVCMGKTLMREYQTLREMLESAPVDLGTVVEFHGRLNQRRRDLGYNFKQFDEREWGYLFEDMDSEDDGDSTDAGGGNTNGWGYWPEALDPSSCVVKKPAAESFIATIPRKTFAEAKQRSEETQCPVCRGEFADDVVVAQLPCGHLFCGVECIDSWLRMSNSCPTCRAKLPSKEDEVRQAEQDISADSVLDDGREDEAVDGAQDDTPKADAVEMTFNAQKTTIDEDAVMTDVDDLEDGED